MVEVTDGGSVDMENTIGGEISVPIGHPVETDDRQFTVKNIKQPGGWRTNPDLQRVFDQCESFEISFSKPDILQKLKLGSIFFLFSTAKEAQFAYTQLSGSKLDGDVLSIETSDKFVIPGSTDFFKISNDQTVRARTIYALNLATADRGPLEGILGQDAIVSVKFMSQEEDKQQAEIVMSSEEEAKSARQDANIFEDEDPSSSMKLLTSEEYDNHVKEIRNKSKKAEALRPKTDFKQNDKENKPVAMAPEVEEEDIINALNQQVEEEKLNWAELTEVEELYSICDKASEKFNGLPDSILKPAMLSTLNRHLQETESHWLREHLMTLIGVWRREVESEVPYIRETQVIMKAPEYQPVLVNKSRKRKAKDTRAGKIMMGVGALLQSTRVSMRTENGDVEIDEDDGGNIMLNGEMLSFASWAKATRTNQPEIVVAEESRPQVQTQGQEQTNGKQRKPKPQREFMDFADYKKYKKEQYEKRMGNKKMKIMNQHRREMAELEAMENQSVEAEEPEVKTVSDVKPLKELDEGEIDSEEERQMEKTKKKAKKGSDSSSSSSSSEGSDDEDGPSNARGRRAQMRKLKQKKMANNPTSNPIMTNIFDFRHQITKHLPLDQKKLLVQQLREVIQSHGSMTMEQNNMYMKFSDDVTRLSR